MLRLDDASRTKLQEFVERFDASKAEIIRQLIAQAKEEDFQKSWQRRAAEHRVQPRSLSF
jgi:predicted transcriptional regulator